MITTTPGVLSEELTCKIVEQKFMDIYEKRINELGSSYLSLKENFYKDYSDRSREGREKDKKITRLEEDLNRMKIINDKILSSIVDIQQKYDRLIENLVKIQKKFLYVSIERFDFNFLSSNNSNNDFKIKCENDRDGNVESLDQIYKAFTYEREEKCNSEFGGNYPLEKFSDRYFKISDDSRVYDQKKESLYDNMMPIQISFPNLKENGTVNKFEDMNLVNFSKRLKVEEFLKHKSIDEKANSKVSSKYNHNQNIDPRDFKSVLVLIKDSNSILNKI